MSEDQKEALSALMDGEANELELRRLLKQAGPEQDEQWSRFHIAGRALRGEAQPFLDLDISSRISAAIGDVAPAPRKMPGFLKPLTGLAVAAGVAAVVVFGSGTLPTTDTGLQPQLATAGTAAQADGRVWPATGSSGTGNVTASANAGATPALSAALANSEARARFQRQMLRHTRRVVDNSGYGMLSYARVVYEVEE